MHLQAEPRTLAIADPTQTDPHMEDLARAKEPAELSALVQTDQLTLLPPEPLARLEILSR